MFAERDKTISEQKQIGFMEKLDLWSEENIFKPHFGTYPKQDDLITVERQVTKAIREQILEIQHRGTASKGAGAPPPPLPLGAQPAGKQQPCCTSKSPRLTAGGFSGCRVAHPINSRNRPSKYHGSLKARMAQRQSK